MRRRRHTVRNVAALTALALVLGTGTAAATAYAKLQSQINTVNIDDLVAAPAPVPGATATDPADPSAGQALTILVIGSDSRDDGQVSDGVTSVLADTHILVHIAADRSRVELVSIPRDTMVDIPECPTTSGRTVNARFGQYNSAFAEAYVAGGDVTSAIACDVNLAQSLTGVTIDGSVLVEMGGFVQMVDAIGGIDICIPEAIDAPKADLVLAAGQQTLNGTQALGYARARVGVGDGSDIGRIDRQQHLLGAMVAGVLSRNVLSDAGALYNLAAATLGSLTTSPNLSSVPDMVGLGLGLRGITQDKIVFVTTPFAAYPADRNRVIFTDEVEDIWAAMRADQPIAGESVGAEESDGDGGGLPSADGEPTPTAGDAAENDGEADTDNAGDGGTDTAAAGDADGETADAVTDQETELPIACA